MKQLMTILEHLDDQTFQEIKKKVEDITGMKTSMRKLKSGSMKGYLMFTPRRTGKDKFPTFPFEATRRILEEFPEHSNQYPNFASIDGIHLYVGFDRVHNE